MMHAARHEPIGRAIGGSPISVMTIADVVLRENAAYPDFKTFHCSTLRCDISLSACKSNYLGGRILSCKGCAVGGAHAGNTPMETDRHTNADAVRALACIRCEKNAYTNKRLIGRMRLVRSATLCVSCVNRHLEFEKRANSKGGMPRLVLFPAIITIQTTDGEQKTLDIGLRLDYLECARYVERVHPGAALIETAIDGEIVPQFSLWTPLPYSPWEPDMVRDEKPSKPKRTYTHRATGNSNKPSSSVSEPVDWDDWDTPLYAKPARDDHSDADGSRNVRRHGWLPPMDEEDDATYRASFNEPALDPESIGAFWDGMNADGLPDFIEWLCDDWTTLDIKAAAPVADIPASVAPAIDSEPLVDDSDIPEQESEWAGCSITIDGVTTYVCDYAKERGISDEEAAIILGMCDPEYAAEAEAAATPEPEPAPEPVKAEPAPIPKKLTGKQLRKLEKAQRRAGRMAAAPAPPEMPTLGKSPRAIAITARAVVQVAFELNGFKA